MYDYILTLPLEISTVWKQKFSATTVLFFINRYFFMMSSVSGALTHINAIKNMTASRLYASQWLTMTSLSISGVREKQYTVGPPGMLTFSFYEGVKWSLVYGLSVLRSLPSLFGVCISAPMDFLGLDFWYSFQMSQQSSFSALTQFAATIGWFSVCYYPYT